MVHPPADCRRRAFRRTFLSILVAIVASAPACGAATAHEVAEAIDRAKAFLYAHEKGGNWELAPAPDGKDAPASVRGRQWGGLTSIAVYALLAAGENPQDPHLAPAIEWLKKAKMLGGYAVGIRCQIWTFLPEKETHEAAKTDLDTLSKAFYEEGPGQGFYPYFITPEGVRGPKEKNNKDYFDLSVSQYGVLGMWALEQAGQEIPGKYWETVDAAWKSAQQNDGGWPYHKGDKARATMTAAGIATLYITQDHLLIGHHWDPCMGGQKNDHIDNGLAYMDKHVPELLDGNYYGMYGVERIGVASGRKYFGTIDWYAQGAEFLVRHQLKDGSWNTPEASKLPKLGVIPDTAFAMLFLTRGRAPVMMNKLEWYVQGKDEKKAAQPDPWNERPRDLANLARWGGKEIEKDLNWQFVDLKGSAEALHDAPILYISGSEPLDFDDAGVAKLRDFVSGGGLILGNADCASERFSKSFTELGAKLFPKYELRELPPTHPIYKDEQYVASKWSAKPKVLGLSNQVRELMILIPEADLSRAWQTRSEQIRQEAFELGQNIFLYSIDKSNLIDRGESYLVRPNPKVKPTHEVKLARLEIGDNPDPEPGGWPRFAAILHNEAAVHLEVQSVKLDDSSLAGFKIAHLTGTTKFTLTGEQRGQLKRFVEGGGTLIVDAAGGSSDFADAAEKELAATFGDAGQDLGAELPADSPVYKIDGAQIESFHYRNFAKKTLTGKLDAPRIRGILVGKRTGVFYSREDLSGGLVGQPVDGVLGYTPQTASDLMRNIVLYAAGITDVPKVASEPAGPDTAAPAKGAKPKHKPK